MRPKTRRCVIEPCGYCLAEMERLGETLAGLYKRAESFEEKKKEELAA